MLCVQNRRLFCANLIAICMGLTVAGCVDFTPQPVVGLEANMEQRNKDAATAAQEDEAVAARKQRQDELDTYEKKISDFRDNTHGIVAGAHALFYVATLENVESSSDDYDYDALDITFWDVPSQREATTGTPLAADSATPPSRLTNQLNAYLDQYVELTGIPYTKAVPPDVSATYQGTIKHVYQIDGGALNKGVGAIDIQYDAGPTTQWQAVFTLADIDGNNLLPVGVDNPFRFSSFDLMNLGTVEITHNEGVVGIVEDVSFYGEEGNNIGGKLSVNIDLPLSLEGASLQSSGVFAAQR